MKVVFMGTPDFSVPILRALVENGYEVAGVFTQPDKPKGRGGKVQMTPVKEYALSQNIPVFQPLKIRKDGLDDLKSLAPDLCVTAAFGQILSQEVLDVPKIGTVNVHTSLLPRHRGAAPVQWTVWQGETVTGVTTMFTDRGIDTGDMLLRAEVPIREEDNFESVHDRMAEAGAALLLETIAALRAGTLVRIPQDDSLATYAPKIEKADCLLDFSMPGKAVFDRVRGLSPIPLSFTHTPDGKLLKVVAARRARLSGSCGAPGTVLSLDTAQDGGIEVACGEGSLLLTRVVPEGKAPMSAADYIRGRRLSVGERLG